MVKVKKFILKNIFNGMPKASDVEMVEEELPSIKDEEFLAEAIYLSIDPFTREFNQTVVGDVLIGTQIAKIVESKSNDYPVGKYVVAHFGWRTHTIAKEIPPPEGILPDYGELPLSLALGILGIPGNTAYFGFLEVCQPREGETVVVSSAGGTIGSTVGQIAKICGCKVIGILGSDEKGRCITEELGFDHYINYKKGNVKEELAKLAPNGVDCYFDNVGGEISDAVIKVMNDFGRIAICGFMSQFSNEPKVTNNSCKGNGSTTVGGLTWEYKEDMFTTAKVPSLQPYFVFKQLRMEGFIVYKWMARWKEGVEQNLKWVNEGKLKFKETITEGFENAFQEFLNMLEGKSVGKALVKI
ncbi:hypothetical protein RI129_012809 [Pyrocoelia pectoralis]|uniref:Prostaglandin reductase 1 n=1 Tax=Pyrocoelia pectoralis TaxID=417401 RepID=A0AAN7V1A8_9COLE